MGGLGDMLANAPQEQVERWESVPADGRWYTLQPPAIVADDPFEGQSGWPNLAAGNRHWKTCMTPPATFFANLLRAFGIEPHCTLCKASTACQFDTHTVSPGHFRAVCDVVDEHYELAREELWHETLVVGGRTRYNHLDGEVQVLREVPEETEYSDVLALQDLPEHSVWLLGGRPASVAVNPAGCRQHWPNLWSHRNWKEKMVKVSARLTQVLAANGDVNGCRCMVCPDRGIGDHLLGPKHFAELAARVPDGTVVELEKFWQTWTFATGAVAFNHVDGTVRMVKRPPGVVDVPRVAPAASVGGPISAEGDRAAAGVGKPTPNGVAATASTGAAQPPPPPPSDCPSNAFAWVWRKHVASQLPRLQAALGAAGVPRAAWCGICGAPVGDKSLPAHLLEVGHITRVHALFEQYGPNVALWTQQCGSVLIHHLSLDAFANVTVSATSASPSAVVAAAPLVAPSVATSVVPGAAVDAARQPAAFNANAVATTASGQDGVAATGDQTGVAAPAAAAAWTAAAPGTQRQQQQQQQQQQQHHPLFESQPPAQAPAPTEPSTELSRAAQAAGWEAFMDPETRAIWYYNSNTDEVAWTEPLLDEASIAKKGAVACGAGQHRSPDAGGSGDEAAGAVSCGEPWA